MMDKTIELNISIPISYKLQEIVTHIERMYVDTIQSIEIFLIVFDNKRRIVDNLERTRLRLSNRIYVRADILESEIDIELSIRMKHGSNVRYELNRCWYEKYIYSNGNNNEIKILDREFVNNILSDVKKSVKENMDSFGRKQIAIW